MKSFIKIIIAACILFTGIVQAQDYTIDVNNAKKIEITSLTGYIKIVGHSGSNILVEADELVEPPARAEGLKPLSANGVDNTGIGLTINEAGGVIIIAGATKQSADANYVFKVPNTLAVMVDYYSPFTSDDVQVENFSGEFEMKGLNDGAKLTNVTGPVFLDLVNGDVEIIFGSLSQKSPMSIKTINGDIDLAFPASAKANLELYSLHGDIYTDLDISMEKKEKEGSMNYIGGSNKMKGTLNGGGVDVQLSSINGNLFLREK